MARLEFANALRGLAALSVVIAHYNTFFIGNASLIGTIANVPPPIREPSPALDAWQGVVLSFPFGGGEFGVALFFLISGFVIPISLQKYDWRGFLVGRVLRIYPTYIAGFSVTLVALLIAGATFGKPFPFEARAAIIHFLPGARDLAWSPHIDFIVWTLEIEIKFYIVCAVAWKWLRRGDRRAFAIPLAMAGCAIGIVALLPGWLTSNATMYRLGYIFATTARFLSLMFIGVAFFYHYRHRLGNGALGAISLTLFALFWLLSTNAPAAAMLQSWREVSSYLLALVVFAASYAFSQRWPQNRLTGFLADVSYPLYVVHAVAGYVALRILVAHDVAPVAALILALSGALLLSWLLHIAVEMPTHRLGQRWARAMTRREDDRRTQVLAG